MTICWNISLTITILQNIQIAEEYVIMRQIELVLNNIATFCYVLIQMNKHTT